MALKLFRIHAKNMGAHHRARTKQQLKQNRTAKKPFKCLKGFGESMMSYKKAFGDIGEEFAAQHLKKNKYKILEIPLKLCLTKPA